MMSPVTVASVRSSVSAANQLVAKSAGQQPPSESISFTFVR